MQSYCYVTSNNEQFFIGYERVVEAANYNVYCISCHRSHCYKFPSSLILHSIIYLTYSTPFPPPPLNAHIEKYFKISQLLLMEARVSFLDHVCVFHPYWHVQSSREESQDFSLSIHPIQIWFVWGDGCKNCSQNDIHEDCVESKS